MSVDIGAGQRWSREIDEHLSRTDFGILCLTRDNLQAPWLLFEAGALAKKVGEDARVVPYLMDDMEPEEIKQPLGLFQSKKADKAGTYDLIYSINSRLENRIEEERVKRTFERSWHHLEKSLKYIPASETEPEHRSNEDILGELLESVRSISRRLDQTTVSFPDALKLHSNDIWGRIVTSLKSDSSAVAAVYEEARCLLFTEDELVLEFPEDLSIYTKLAGEQKRSELLLKTIESLCGFRPSLRFTTGTS